LSNSKKIKKLNHIGIAVKSIEESLKFYRDALGLEVAHIEEVESQGVRVAMLPIGDKEKINLELIEPLNKTNQNNQKSNIQKFLEKNGPGIHHIALETGDINQTCEALKTKNITLTSDKPMPGAHDTRVNFIHPKSTSGVLLELVEQAELAK